MPARPRSLIVDLRTMPALQSVSHPETLTKGAQSFRTWLSGGGGNRTPVPRSRLGSISGRSRRFGSRRCRAHRRARQLPAR